jgi:hypothetical protein
VTSGNFRIGGFLVHAAFAAKFKFEVFDRIGDINLFSGHIGCCQRSCKKQAGRTNEWAARNIFSIPRLFANKHDRGVRRALAKDSLGGVFPQGTSAAILSRFAQRFN